jgi:glutathione peroxidase
MGIHDLTAKTIDGTDQSLGAYKGKVLLVVNVASQCGLTPHYGGLQELYDSYKDRGLVVLGFPCNQFGPGARYRGRDQDVLRDRFGVTFRCSPRST